MRKIKITVADENGNVFDQGELTIDPLAGNRSFGVVSIRLLESGKTDPDNDLELIVAGFQGELVNNC